MLISSASILYGLLLVSDTVRAARRQEQQHPAYIVRLDPTYAVFARDTWRFAAKILQ